MESYKFPSWREVGYAYSQGYQLAEMLALCTLGFLLPFAFGHPQLLIGAAVNAFLIRSAASLPSYKLAPVIIAPAVVALARGVLFGPFTPYLALMVPFIWVGNALLVYAFKARIANGWNYAATLTASSLVKAAFLYLAAFVLYSAGLIPAAILGAMGVMQLSTALIGGAIAYPFVRR
ncbi:MAG: hypothetical protein PHG85_06620 [Candidatus Altiarchaeota archaeon]|nr:hypothetical protein [Candidatus Altiarchaeota archaeon]